MDFIFIQPYSTAFTVVKCTRLGIVRGLDLAQASKNAYPRFVNFCLYILAQIAIIACDLAEIIGMAIGLQLLFHLPLIWGVSLTITDTVLMLFLMNKGMRKLEAVYYGDDIYCRPVRS